MNSYPPLRIAGRGRAISSLNERVGLRPAVLGYLAGVHDHSRRSVLGRRPEIAEVAVRQGMRLMRDDGIEKVRHGMTSIEEVTRVTGTGAAAVEV